MTASLTRPQLLDAVEILRQHWRGHARSGLDTLLSEHVALFSSHRGNHHGKVAVLGALVDDLEPLRQLDLEFSNTVVRADKARAVASSYFHAAAVGAGSSLQFGGLLIIQFEQDQICEIRIQLAWHQGDFSVASDWKLPVADRQWQPGDVRAIVMSEIDAPWNRVPHSILPSTDEDAVVEAWYRYAWALDQADFALLPACFHQDVEAELTPMGRLHGRRTLVTTLKAFRMPWPWMQHCGAPIAIQIDADGQQAELTLGRIIPGRTATADGQKVYGAHYRIRLTRESDNGWAITYMEYLPGWFTA
jgi:hypothetical protein